MNGGISLYDASSIWLKESTKNATFQFVFEPNDLNTWTRVKSMIENFLTRMWLAGALQGATTEQAYYVGRRSWGNYDSIRYS